MPPHYAKPPQAKQYDNTNCGFGAVDLVTGRKVEYGTYCNPQNPYCNQLGNCQKTLTLGDGYNKPFNNDCVKANTCPK